MERPPHPSPSSARRLRRAVVGAGLAAATTAALLVAVPASATSPMAAASWENTNTAFVQRDGSTLTLDGEPFRASGTNIYWLGLDENVGGVDFPTYFRIKDALDTAKQLGVTVVRSHMMTSTGQNDEQPLALMPRLGEYNDEAFETIDFAVAYAGTLGIRLILPLTDEWQYYHGGHRDFTTPLGLESADFYTDPTAIAAYQDYVDHILGRTNSITGTKYVDDPTVLAWELGNELEGMTQDWITAQVAHIKERAPEQFVAAGRRFDIDPDTLAVPDLDIVDVHYYPPTAERVSADAATIAGAGKVYIAGEYASTAATAGLLESAAADPNVSGMFFWSLFGHNDRGGFVPHDDGFTLHYPGSSDRERESVAAIRQYGIATGSTPGEVEPGAPLITAIDKNYGINLVSWRGTAGASGYLVQRSVDDGGWTDVTDAPVLASASPVTDYDSPADSRYRVVPVGDDGARGPASDVVDAPAVGAVLVDPLQSWSLSGDHENVRISPTPTGGIARTVDGGAASITWQRDGISSAAFDVTDPASVTVATSADGVTWTDVATSTRSADGRTVVDATGLSGTAIRLTWTGSGAVERATITSAADDVALFDPLADFSKTSSHDGALSFDSGNPAQFGGDTTRVKRDSADAASLTWSLDDISGADIQAWYWPDQPVQPLLVETSTDGSTWTPTTVETRGGTGNWIGVTLVARGLSGANQLRVTWPEATNEVWTPQIGAVSLYSPNAGELGAPGAVALTAPEDDASGVTATPTFTWAPATDAAYYRFELAAAADPSTPLVSTTGLSATAYRPPVDLEPETRYTWSVTAVNGIGATSSNNRAFSTAALPTEPVVVDDFEGYADDAAVRAAYVRNTGGGTFSPTLVENPRNGHAARFDYDLGTAGYAGAVRAIASAQNWWGYSGLTLHVDSATDDDTSDDLAVQFVANGAFWEAQVTPEPGAQTIEIPFSDFAPPAWAPAAELDLTSVSQFAVYLNGSGSGRLTLDDIETIVIEDAPTPTPTPTPTATPEPTSSPEPTTSPEPTSTPEPSATPSPTPSITPSTGPLVPAPTGSPAPSPSPEAGPNEPHSPDSPDDLAGTGFGGGGLLAGALLLLAGAAVTVLRLRRSAIGSAPTGSR